MYCCGNLKRPLRWDASSARSFSYESSGGGRLVVRLGGECADGVGDDELDNGGKYFFSGSAPPADLPGLANAAAIEALRRSARPGLDFVGGGLAIGSSCGGRTCLRGLNGGRPFFANRSGAERETIRRCWSDGSAPPPKPSELTARWCASDVANRRSCRASKASAMCGTTATEGRPERTRSKTASAPSHDKFACFKTLFRRKSAVRLFQSFRVIYLMFM